MKSRTGIRPIHTDPIVFVCPEGFEPLTSGSEKLCQALVSYFNKEMTIAEIAKFAIIPGTPYYMGTHTIVMSSGAFQYSTSVQKLRDAAHDFTAGFEAAHG